MMDEGSSVTIKKDGSFVNDNEEQKSLINKSEKKFKLKGKKKLGENEDDDEDKNEKNQKKKDNNDSDDNNEEDEEKEENHKEDEEKKKEKEQRKKELLKQKEEKKRQKLIKVIRNKNTDLEKIREEIEKMLNRDKKQKEKETEEEKEKRRKRRGENKERQKKEKERREKEANKIREQIRKKREDKNKSQPKMNSRYNKKNNFLKIKNSDIAKDKFRKKNTEIKDNPDNKLHFSKNLKLKPFNGQIPLNQYVFESINPTDNQDNSNKNKFRTIFSEDHKTELYDLKKRYHNKRKNNVNVNIFSDPLNPYLTNWARSFLKIGYNEGIWANKMQGGVPLLRLNRLKPKLEFPPIYKIKYNQFSKGNIYGFEENYYKKDYMNENDLKKRSYEDQFDSRNSSSNNLFSSDRKFNIDKDINIDEKNKTIDFSKHS